jgi:uncharacterized coiled-coil protein SlyX
MMEERLKALEVKNAELEKLVQMQNRKNAEHEDRAKKLATKIAELEDKENKQALIHVQLQEMVGKLAAKNSELENSIKKVLELVGSHQSTVQAQQAPHENVSEDNNGGNE